MKGVEGRETCKARLRTTFYHVANSKCTKTYLHNLVDHILVQIVALKMCLKHKFFVYMLQAQQSPRAAKGLPSVAAKIKERVR